MLIQGLRRSAVVAIWLLLILTLQGWSQQSEAVEEQSVSNGIGSSGDAQPDNAVPIPPPDEPQPLTVKQKLDLALKSSGSPLTLGGDAAAAYIYYAQRSNPSFGLGWPGYGRRYAAAVADSTIGDWIGLGILPSLLREDPRYYPSGTGPIKSRIVFALHETFRTRTDAGDWQFAYASWLGAGATVGISNLYYRDSRTFDVNLEKFALQILGSAGYNEFQEFRKDLKRIFLRRPH